MFWERRSDIAGQPFTLRGYMVNQKHTRIFIRIAAALLLVPFLCGITSCSMLKDILNGKEPGNSSTATKDPYGRDPDASYESLEPTGSYTSEAFDNKAADADFIKSILVHSVWYDVVSGNPADYDSISSEKAFALKGVFYFSEPLTAVFEARLCKDGETILKREVKIDRDVTCGCDFSAGLEGLGTFDAGSYTVVLLYDGIEVAKTDVMRVE